MELDYVMITYHRTNGYMAYFARGFGASDRTYYLSQQQAVSLARRLNSLLFEMGTPHFKSHGIELTYWRTK